MPNIGRLKVAPLVNLIRGKKAFEAVHILSVQNKKGGSFICKLIQSAIANAEQKKNSRCGSIICENHFC